MLKCQGHWCYLKSFIFILLLLRGHCALECRDGQYQSGDKCRECKTTCAKCISDSLCTECKTGVFGSACAKNCSERCLEKRCFQETGACISCLKGYYRNIRCEQCPEKCTECLNADKCTNCMTGYTGIICEKLCVNCKPESGCSLEGICNDGCKDGYSGYSCTHYCSSNCLSCSRVDAKICLACVSGQYGRNCEQLCPAKCIDNICSKYSGSCTHGCQNGFWGDQCEYVCPVNCRDGKCLRSSGMCSDGCLGNFTGTKCLCPITCDCDVDGACAKCDKNTGYVCDKQCRSMCIINICSVDTEKKCFYGCRDGYDGDLCSPLMTVPDYESGHRVEMITLAVCSAVLFIVTGTVVCFLYRQRKSTGASRMNGNQQTERRPLDELSGTYSETYVHDSEQYSVIDPSLAVSESSYITPVYTGVNPRNQYEIMDSEYIPLSAIDSSENQYLQPAKEISTSMA